MKGGSHSKISMMWPVRPLSNAATLTLSVALDTVPVTERKSNRRMAGWLSATSRKAFLLPRPVKLVLFQVALATAVRLKVPLLVTTVKVGLLLAVASPRPNRSSGQALPRVLR